MRTKSISPSKAGNIYGRFIPNKPNQPQLGKLRVQKADGSIVEIPMNRADRRAAVRADRRRQKKEARWNQ